MQFSLATVILGFAALAAAAPSSPQGFNLVSRQNAIPKSTCCVANVSLKQDRCTTANNRPGRCVPGGNNCGNTLSCVAQESLVCDNNVRERSGVLCRARASGGKLFDGSRLIDNLGQAQAN